MDGLPCVGDALMKIPPSKIATTLAAEPVNRPKEVGALKPLADSDFAAQLKAVTQEKPAEDSPESRGSRHALRPLTPADMIHGLKGPVPEVKPLDIGSSGHPTRPGVLPLGEAQNHHSGAGAPQAEQYNVPESGRNWGAR